jgi:hypothetical protein
MSINQRFREKSQKRSSFATLRQFVQSRPVKEQCELCGVALGYHHQHLLDPTNRQLLCACDACALLFDNQAATRFLRVPLDIRFLPDFQLSEAVWDSLLIPVNMAFFFYDSQAGKMTAFYPSPAGPTESLLNLEAWNDLVHDNPLLKDIQPDVEALLVNRVKVGHEYYLAPIDKCYELVGLIRSYWKGLSGGPEVWQEIERFFVALKQRSRPVKEQPHA